MIEREVAEEFIGCEVAIKKKDGYTWVGIIKRVNKNSLVLDNKKHGKSAISLSAVESIELRKGGVPYD